MRFGWIIVLAVGCGGGSSKDGSSGDPPLGGDAEPAACAGDAAYPEGAVEPMALGEVLTPYRWPVAIDRSTGERAPLDLADAPCDLDAAHNWGRFEAMLFVSIPAW